MSFQEHIAEKQADSGTKSSSVQHQRLQALKHMSIVGRVGRVQHACITWSCIYHMVFMECLRALNLQTRLFSSRVTNSSTLDTYRALRNDRDVDVVDIGLDNSPVGACCDLLGTPEPEILWSEAVGNSGGGPPSPEDLCATVDTGCQRMAVGLETLKRLDAALPEGFQTGLMKQEHHFRSVHGRSTTSHVATVPSCLGPRGSILKPAVFQDEASKNAPFLISLPFLMHGRAILHLDPEEGLKIVFRRFGFSTKCHLGPTGALRIPLGDFTRIQKNHLNRINEELVMQQHEFEVLRTAAISENGDQSCPSGNPIRDEHRADGDLCVQQEGQTGSVAWDGTHDRNGLDKDRGEALVHHGAGDNIDVPADVAPTRGGESLYSAWPMTKRLEATLSDIAESLDEEEMDAGSMSLGSYQMVEKKKHGSETASQTSRASTGASSYTKAEPYLTEEDYRMLGNPRNVLINAKPMHGWPRNKESTTAESSGGAHWQGANSATSSSGQHTNRCGARSKHRGSTKVGRCRLLPERPRGHTGRGPLHHRVQGVCATSGVPNDPGFPSPRGHSGQRHLRILIMSSCWHLMTTLFHWMCAYLSASWGLASRCWHLMTLSLNVSYYLSASWGQASRCWHNIIISWHFHWMCTVLTCLPGIKMLASRDNFIECHVLTCLPPGAWHRVIGHGIRLKPESISKFQAFGVSKPLPHD